VACASGEVAGDLVGKVPMGQRQRMGSGMGMDWPLAPGLRVGRLCLRLRLRTGTWPGWRCAGAPCGTAASAWGMALAPLAPGSMQGLGFRLNGP
jgi:hypothetical protein